SYQVFVQKVLQVRDVAYVRLLLRQFEQGLGRLLEGLVSWVITHRICQAMDELMRVIADLRLGAFYGVECIVEYEAKGASKRLQEIGNHNGTGCFSATSGAQRRHPAICHHLRDLLQDSCPVLFDVFAVVWPDARVNLLDRRRGV